LLQCPKLPCTKQWYLNTNDKMNVFKPKTTDNLLPSDGEANYYGKILEEKVTQKYFERLMHTIAWEHDEVIIFGKRIVTKRKTAWYGDQNYAYTYSKTTKKALPWTKALKELKTEVEAASGFTFNSCLLNLYHNGDEGMGWHSDDENTLIKNAPIASLSLGAKRKFSFKHKSTKQTVSVILEDGSLLLMKAPTQTYWLHSLPKTRKVNTSRINLTFRTMLET